MGEESSSREEHVTLGVTRLPPAGVVAFRRVLLIDLA
jgi:hypothetical protein